MLNCSLPPSKLIEFGKASSNFFNRIETGGRPKFLMKTVEEFSRENSIQEKPSKRYFNATKLPDIIQNYPIHRKGLSQKEIDKEKQNRVAFVDFLQGLLTLNPFERWSPQQAKLHPFVTGEPFTGKFQPPMQFTGRSSRSSTSSVAGSTTSNQASTLVANTEHPAATTRQRSSTISTSRVSGAIPPRMLQLTSVNENAELEKTEKTLERQDSMDEIPLNQPDMLAGKTNMFLQNTGKQDGGAPKNASLALGGQLETAASAFGAPKSPKRTGMQGEPHNRQKVGEEPMQIQSRSRMSRSPYDKSTELLETKKSVSPVLPMHVKIPQSDEEKMRQIREEARKFAEKMRITETVSEAPEKTPAESDQTTPNARSSAASHMRKSLSRRSFAEQQPEETEDSLSGSFIRKSTSMAGIRKKPPGAAMQKTTSMNGITQDHEEDEGVLYAVPYEDKQRSRKSLQPQKSPTNSAIYRRRGSHDVTNMPNNAYEAYQQQKQYAATQGAFRRRGSYDMTGTDPQAVARFSANRSQKQWYSEGNLQTKPQKQNRRQNYQQPSSSRVPPPLKIPSNSEAASADEKHFLYSSGLQPTTPHDIPISPTVYARPPAPAPPPGHQNHPSSHSARGIKARSQSMSTSNKDIYAMVTKAVASTQNLPLPYASSTALKDRRQSAWAAPSEASVGVPSSSGYSRQGGYDEFPPLSSQQQNNTTTPGSSDRRRSRKLSSTNA